MVQTEQNKNHSNNINWKQNVLQYIGNSTYLINTADVHAKILDLVKFIVFGGGRQTKHRRRSSVNFGGKTFLPKNICMKN